MEKKLIEHIGDMNHCNYADVSDFLRDIHCNSPERKVEILAEALQYIESKERKETYFAIKSKDGKLDELWSVTED